MDSSNLKHKVIANLLWKLMERSGAQGMQFILQIILARLLLPEDYGIIALVLIFITLANVFVQSGFNNALIQKKHADEIDFSSVFYLSFFVAGVLYLTLYFISPIIATFYKEPLLIPVLRVLSLTLFFGAFNSIQNAIVARKMQFKKQFFSGLGAIIISGTVGVVLAYAGYGVWALVAQQMTSQLLIVLILWFTVKWRPRLLFSFERVKVLFSYGWKLLASSFLDTLYMDLRSLIIGKMYNAEMLGFYNRGKQFPSLIVTNINGSIQSVIFPVLAAQQDNKQRVKDIMRRAITTSSFLIFPVMMGLAVIAEPLVRILLTDKWLPCVPFLQINCMIYGLWPIHTANLQAINALGRSDIFLKLEIIKKIQGLAILSVTVFYGVYAIAWGGALAGITSSFINAYPNKRLLDYGYIDQIKDIMPAFFLSVIMAIGAYSIKFIGMNPGATLIMQIITGIVIYTGLARITRIKSYEYLLHTLKDMRKKDKEI